MLYPVLHRLEDRGLIKSRWAESETGRKRKYYSLKEDGKKALNKRRDQWLTVNVTLTRLWKEKYARPRTTNRRLALSRMLAAGHQISRSVG